MAQRSTRYTSGGGIPESTLNDDLDDDSSSVLSSCEETTRDTSTHALPPTHAGPRGWGRHHGLISSSDGQQDKTLVSPTWAGMNSTPEDSIVDAAANGLREQYCSSTATSARVGLPGEGGEVPQPPAPTNPLQINTTAHQGTSTERTSGYPTSTPDALTHSHVGPMSSNTSRSHGLSHSTTWRILSNPYHAKLGASPPRLLRNVRMPTLHIISLNLAATLLILRIYTFNGRKMISRHHSTRCLLANHPTGPIRPPLFERLLIPTTNHFHSLPWTPSGNLFQRFKP